MRSKKLKKLIICSLICTSIGVYSGSISAKAMSFNEVYQNTYNTVVNLQNLGKKYYITPRNSHNGSKMEDNRLEDIVNSVNEIQPSIDKLREYQHKFPSKDWKARNTFSEIGDGYQQPIYEWIVDIAIRNNKKIDELKKLPKEELYKEIINIQKEISSGIILNKGVDIAYRKAYRVALENDQEKLDKFIKNNKDKSNLEYAKFLGEILGQDTKGQIKKGDDLIKKLQLNQSSYLDYSLRVFGANPFRDEIDFIADIQERKMDENRKVILSHIMALNSKQTLGYCRDKSDFSSLYGFTQSAIIEEPNLLKDVKNPINRDFIKMNLDDISEIGKRVEEKYPKSELLTPEDYMAPATSEYIALVLYPVDMDFYYIGDVKRITNTNDFPKIFSEIPNGEKYYERLKKPSIKGDLLSGAFSGDVYVERCHSYAPAEKLDKVYYNHNEKVIYEVGKNYISIYDTMKGKNDNRNIGKPVLTYNIKTKEVSTAKKDETKKKDKDIKKHENKKLKLVLNKDGIKAIDNFNKLREKVQKSSDLINFKIAYDYLKKINENSIKFGISDEKIYDMESSLNPVEKKIAKNIKSLEVLKDFTDNYVYMDKSEIKECFERICIEVSKEAKEMKNSEDVNKVCNKIIELDKYRVSDGESKNYVILVNDFVDRTYKLYKDGIITKKDATDGIGVIFGAYVHGFDSNFFYVQGILNKVKQG